jgi:hypothetical protein
MFGTGLFQKSHADSAVVLKVYVGCLQSVHTSCEIVLGIGHDRFLPDRYHFIIEQSS